jgi:Lon protease-like protein
VGEVLPLFPLGTVLFPGALLPLHVFEPRYRALVRDLVAGPEPRHFGVVAIREGHEVGADSIKALYDVGCVAEVRRVDQLPDGRYALQTAGFRRFRLLDLDHSRPYLTGQLELIDEPHGDGAARDAPADRVREMFATYRSLLDPAAEPVELPEDPTALSYAVAAGLAVALPERQALLESPGSGERLGTEAEVLARELAIMRGLRAMPLSQPPLRPGSLN